MGVSVVPGWNSAYRIINSAFPPINVFEDTLDPEDLEIAFLIEAMTNDRLRDQAGDLHRIAPSDRLCGPGSTPVMAAFTHIGRPSRFTDGTYGVYYCASSVDAAIAETRYHQEAFWRATREPGIEITMRTYVNQVVKPMLDIRLEEAFHQPSPAAYASTQRFAKQQRQIGSWGLLYRSVRSPGAECVAALRPPAVSLPVPGAHFRYRWDGKALKIQHVLEIQLHDASEQRL